MSPPHLLAEGIRHPDIRIKHCDYVRTTRIYRTLRSQRMYLPRWKTVYCSVRSLSSPLAKILKSDAMRTFIKLREEH
jgi:hypothetical protein